MKLSDCQGKEIVLSNGQVYRVRGPVFPGKSTFWADRPNVFGTIILIQTKIAEPVIIYYDVNYGEMHWQLTYHDKRLSISAYEKYKFREDIEQENVDSGKICIFLRNIGYNGLLSVLEGKSLLNSPEGGFPVTSVATNYDWVYDAHFPCSSACKTYGHYVFAIFSRDGLLFRPTIRTGVVIDPYFHGKSIREFWTNDSIFYSDSLLLTSGTDYEKLVEGHATSRSAGLRILDRSEEEQNEWENRALESAKAILGMHSISCKPSALAPGSLQRLLLEFRANSVIEKGMLFHLRVKDAQIVMVTGEFTSWSDVQGTGAIPMMQINNWDWGVVVPRSVVPPRDMPYRFKFIIHSQGLQAWANGLYQVDNHDPFDNSLISITGLETYFARKRAKRLLKSSC